ncbi:hypothetical protein B0T25DRAFT_576837 [Lasiosphaeria hispida]|uniref:Uncharacterized protein n=1 Tax=Lasiosphaeria hispida TaxID=260671 RepID=A0AAJ0HXU6_9PEZI|nr:hypothetical protein B0T25DRAFT_576837 [Lasiosphaeria hispida]
MWHHGGDVSFGGDVSSGRSSPGMQDILATPNSYQLPIVPLSIPRSPSDLTKVFRQGQLQANTLRSTGSPHSLWRLVPNFCAPTCRMDYIAVNLMQQQQRRDSAEFPSVKSLLNPRPGGACGERGGGGSSVHQIANGINVPTMEEKMAWLVCPTEKYYDAIPDTWRPSSAELPPGAGTAGSVLGLHYSEFEELGCISFSVSWPVEYISQLPMAAFSRNRRTGLVNLPPKSLLPTVPATLQKYERVNRRIRGRQADTNVFDTMDALYVWETKPYPELYIPLSAITAGVAEIADEIIYEEQGCWQGRLIVGDRMELVAGYIRGPLTMHVKIPFGSMDHWFAEEEELGGLHPRDPDESGVEILRSSREVRVEVDGIQVARSSNTHFTRENLVPNFIMEDFNVEGSVDWESFKSKKRAPTTYYLSFESIVGNKMIEDAVRQNIRPTSTTNRLSNLYCFDPDKFDIFVDGKKVDA